MTCELRRFPRKILKSDFENMQAERQISDDATFERYSSFYENAVAGSRYFMCGSFEQSEACVICNEMDAVLLCDYPVGEEKTCDRMLCVECAAEIGRDIHYCDTHFTEWQEFVKTEGVKEQLLRVVAFPEQIK